VSSDALVFIDFGVEPTICAILRGRPDGSADLAVTSSKSIVAVRHIRPVSSKSFSKAFAMGEPGIFSGDHFTPAAGEPAEADSPHAESFTACNRAAPDAPLSAGAIEPRHETTAFPEPMVSMPVADPAAA
jgi:hypothetical protein